MMNQIPFIEILNVIFSGLIFFSILIAFLNYRANIKKQEIEAQRVKDREILDQAILSLKWAYDILTDGGEELPPRADRLNWLTTARHLIRYGQLTSKIKTETYRLICAETEEYWRHRFYSALNHIELRNSSYFMDNENEHWPENIEISSGLIISSFSNWPDGLEDPLDTVDRQEYINNRGAFSGPIGRGLEAYYVRLMEIRERNNRNNSN